MTTKLYNAKILQKDMTIINGEICIKDDTIARICNDDGCEEHCTPEQSIDCQGNLLIPSFKNAHTHSAMTFLRSRADDMPLLQWLQEQVWPQEAKLTAEHVHWFTKLAMLEYISGGTTAAFDMYFQLDAIASAANDMGFKMTMCGSVMDFDGDDAVQKMCDNYEKYKNQGLVDYKLGFHAEYTNGINNLKLLAEAVENYKAPIYCHMSETKAEHDGCYERHNKSPAVLFNELGLWKFGGGVFHAVHVDDTDISIMAKNNVFAISNPGSNLKLASGIAPLTKMQEAGVNIALGTDGAASNNALSMFREMYFACTLQKNLLDNAAACPADNALRWATMNSARAFGLDDCDCLEAGKKADIVMIDLCRPAMLPHNNLMKNIVYSGDTSCVKMTMINGKIVYQNGEFLTSEKAETIIKKCHELMKDFD
ncbi:MAG: amidohydrolase [Oscillospiraceae bacterium]|nr:amidohydrolase [Oscillospiraceae bacterium]